MLQVVMPIGTLPSGALPSGRAGGVPIGHAVRRVGAANRAVLHMPLHFLAAALGVQVREAQRVLVCVLLVRRWCAGWVAGGEKCFGPITRDALHEVVHRL